jgi:hypothetical protein
MPGTVVHHITRPFEIPSLRPGEGIRPTARRKGARHRSGRAGGAVQTDRKCRLPLRRVHGVGSSSWDDSLDHAVVEADLDGRRDDSKTVMTTWHEGEPLAQVVVFLDHTAFEGFTPSHRLAVQLGGTDQERLALETLLHEAASGRTKR